jgi:hypothetical protein
MSSDKRVVIVGSGAAGLSAALAAGRAGADVTLIESTGTIGGNSAILPWLGFHSRRYQRVVDGIAGELVGRLQALGAASTIDLDPVLGSAVSLNNHVFRCLAMRLLADANVRVMLQTLAVDVGTDGDRLRSVIVEQKSGRQKVAGDVFIDASGDGDVAARAGVPWEKGRTADGRVQAPSLAFRIGGIDRDAWVEGLVRSKGAFRELLDNYPDALQKLVGRLPTQQVIVLGGFARLMDQARADGKLDVPTTRVVGVKTHRHDEFVAVCTKVADFDPVDADSLSRAYQDAYAQIPQLMDFFVNWMPGCGNAYLEEVAPIIGIRESRRIMGEYVLTGDDVRQGQVFDDGIGIGAYHIDIHLPDGSRFDSEPTLPYDIPLRSLIARRVENLLVAGKCFSATHEAIASSRVIPICMAEGQAAGLAAAHAARDGVGPRDIDVAKLQSELRASGAILRDDLTEPDPHIVDRIGVI